MANYPQPFSQNSDLVTLTRPLVRSSRVSGSARFSRWRKWVENKRCVGRDDDHGAVSSCLQAHANDLQLEEVVAVGTRRYTDRPPELGCDWQQQPQPSQPACSFMRVCWDAAPATIKSVLEDTTYNVGCGADIRFATPAPEIRATFSSLAGDTFFWVSRAVRFPFFPGRHCAIFFALPESCSGSVPVTNPAPRNPGAKAGKKDASTLLREHPRAVLPPSNWGRINREAAMNWADVTAAGSSSSSSSGSSSSSSPAYLHPTSRYRHELTRLDPFDHDDDDGDGDMDDHCYNHGRVDREPKLEHKIDDCDMGMLPSSLRFPDTGTHLGRLASVFSDRMPCTGMYGLPSHHDSAFTMHDLDSGGAQSELPSLEATTATGSYVLPPPLDMHHFDETAELQQLFPSSSSSSSSSALGGAPGASSLHPHAHIHRIGVGGGVGMGGGSGGGGGPSYSAPSQSSSFGHSVGHFTEPYQSLPSAGDPTTAAHMMMPFSFSAAPLAFDDSDDVAMHESSTGGGSMDEVASLFGHASLQTPPTAITIPRMTIVSPINSFASAPRGMLPPPSLRQEAKHDEIAGDDLDDFKFSPERRKLCVVDGCRSQARAFNRCKRHGGSKRCSHPECTKSVQSRGLCIRHGGGSRCQEEGCTRAAQSHGRCKMHGGGRPCVVNGCDKKAHLKRLCRKHGGGAKCSILECEKWAQRQGMCMTHSKHHHQVLTPPPPSSDPPTPSKPASAPSPSSKRARMSRQEHATM